MSHLVSWFAGIDLGDRRHHVHLTDAAGVDLGEASFSHGGRGIAQLLSWLLDKSGADPGSIGVALEVPHGAVVDGLLDRGFATFAVNPKQADRARELLTLSGAKDDPRDAEGLALALRVVPRIFRHLQPKHPVLVLLRDRARLRADLVKQRTRLSQKIRGATAALLPGDVGAGGKPVGALGRLVPHPVGAGPDPGAGAAAAPRHGGEGVGAVQDPQAHRGGGGGCAAPASPGGRPGSDRWGGGDHRDAGGPVAAGARTGEGVGPGDRRVAPATAGGARRS